MPEGLTGLDAAEIGPVSKNASLLQEIAGAELIDLAALHARAPAPPAAMRKAASWAETSEAQDRFATAIELCLTGVVIAGVLLFGAGMLRIAMPPGPAARFITDGMDALAVLVVFCCGFTLLRGLLLYKRSFQKSFW